MQGLQHPQPSFCPLSPGGSSKISAARTLRDSSWPRATRTALSSSARARPPKVPVPPAPPAPGGSAPGVLGARAHSVPPSPGSYSLSVRDFDQNQGETVKHYKIRNMDNGGYYISPRVTFSSLHELVEYYTRMCQPVGWGGVGWMGMVWGWFGDGTGHPGTLCSLMLVLPPPLCRRQLGWAVHPPGQAVPDPEAAETVVAGRVGGAAGVTETGGEAGSGAVWRSLDG